MPRGDTGKIAFGTLRLDEPPLIGIRAALQESLVAGTEYERFRRMWRLGQYTTRPGGQILVSRIGFESSESATEIWDRRKKDFVTAHPRLGQTSQFAVNLSTMRVAFQLRGATIKPQTFRGNLIALLRESSGYKWKFDFEGVEQETWEDWRSSVDKLTKLSVEIRVPNPHYDDEEVEKLLEDTQSGVIEFVLTGRADGLDIDSSSFIMAAIEHAAKGYGSYQATGVLTEDGVEVKETWKSSLDGDVAVSDVPQDPESREISPDLLASLVESSDEDGDASGDSG